MKKQDIKIIKETLEVLNGQPLRTLGRAGSLIVVDFGEFVETDMPCDDENGKLVRDENGRVVYKKGLRGRHSFSVECSMRLTCGSEILLAKSDITLPNTTLAQTQKNEIDGVEVFDWDNFDWSVRGGNYFDEMVEKYIGDEPFEFIVKKIDVSKFGDVSIVFENHFVLEFFADGSKGSENWCFYEVGTDPEKSLVVMGDGIEKDGMEC